MRNVQIILLALAVMALGTLLTSASSFMQNSDIPGGGLAAGIFGLAALLALACPPAIGAAWVLDRVQQDRMRRAACL